MLRGEDTQVGEGPFDGFTQCLHIFEIIVETKAGAGCRGNAQSPMQDHGTVVAVPREDPPIVQPTCEVFGRDTLDVKANDCSLVLWRRPVDPQAGDSLQSLVCSL